MQNSIEIRLFGHPALYKQGQQIDLNLPHKALALLYYLAMARQVVGRDTLAMLLWATVPLPAARHSLRNMLSQLRAVAGDLLEINLQTVALAATPRQQVDAVVFQQNLAAIQQSASPDLAVWQATLDLYRGDFLAGFYVHQSQPFEDWTTQCRESLRQQFLTNLLALSDAYAASGAIGLALACLDRLLAIEPENEAAYSQQIQLLLRLGRRTEALQCYERYRKMLMAEFNLQPAPALTALLSEWRFQSSEASIVAQANAVVEMKPTGTSDDAPPHRSVPYSPPIPNNLNYPLSAFVGRSQEMAYLAQRLADPTCRLVTIIGPGGMGKTSLTLEFGQRLLVVQESNFADGIFFVPLADIRAEDEAQDEQTLVDDTVSGEAILHAIAGQIGYKLEAGDSIALQIQNYLGSRQALLILDNFEHLVAGTDAVVTLLNKAPRIKMLITSRARLNVRGESVLTLDKLSLPAVPYHADPARALQADGWQTSEAITMFVRRAQQIDPAFTINAETLAAVEKICHLVEGLPLGIELATSMLPLLSCSALALVLAKSLDVLASDARDLPREQRTLGAVFERSWRLLPSQGQQLLAKLAIFPGSFRRDAAEQIAGASSLLLRRLFDQSLLRKVDDDRYAMHRTVHAFAQQKLQQLPAQIEQCQVHYAHFYLKLLAQLEQAQTEAAYANVTGQIEADADNVRAAWRWSVEMGDLPLLELSVGSLQDFYQTVGLYPEAIQLLEGAVAKVRHAVAMNPDDRQARRLLALFFCYTAQFYRLYPRSGELDKGEAWANEAIALGQSLSDPALQGLAYHELARIAQARYDFAAMHSLSEQACRYGRLTNLPQLNAESLNDLGIALCIYTHPLAGVQYFHEALDCLQQRPKLTLEVRIVSNLGLFYLGSHHYQSAYRYLHQRRTQPLFEDWVHKGDLLMALGNYSGAQQEFAQGLALAQTRQMPYWECWLHASSGRLQRLLGDATSAQAVCRMAHQMAQSAGNQFVAQWSLINVGHALAALGENVAAATCYQQAIAASKGGNWFYAPTDAHAGLAALCLSQNDVAAAIPHVEAALSFLTKYGLAAAREPFVVYWSCVRVLDAAGDPRAQEILATAYQIVGETADQVEDKGLQRSFLENVAANRNLIAAAQAAGIV